jgi:hypothetical protein
MADLLHHRATLPAAIWALLLVAACFAALFDSSSEPPTTHRAAPATACSARDQKVPQGSAFDERAADPGQVKQQLSPGKC